MENQLPQYEPLESLLKWTYEGKPMPHEEFEKLCNAVRREEEPKAARLEP